MGKHIQTIVLVAIVLLAAWVRFWQLDHVPPSLNADEVAIGYNAYSMLKTGKDEFGIRYPLTFRSFDDYKMPVYVYLTAGSIYILGYNDFAVRFPSAFLGVLTVVAVYFLVKELFNYELPHFAKATRGRRIADYDKKRNALSAIHNQSMNQWLPILSAFLLAISPWHLQFSRAAYEANGALFFVVLGTLFLLKGLSKGVYLIVGTCSLAISVWTYHSSRVFVPLLLCGFLVLYWKTLWEKKMYVFLSFCIAGLILFPMVRLSLTKEGQMRAMGISIFSDEKIGERFIGWGETDRRTKSIPPVISSLIHNRRLAYIPPIIKGYLAHYNFNFFFSDEIVHKYHAPGVGLLYVWELPFMLIGLYVVIRIRNERKHCKLLLWWFCIAGVAAAPTQQLPHPVRTLVFLPTLQIFTAVGIATLIGYALRMTNYGLKTHHSSLVTLKKIKVFFLLLIVLCFAVGNIFYYFHQYYVHLPVDYSVYWQYGRKEIVEKVKHYKDAYDEVIISPSLDMPYIFFLYYLKYDPARYLEHGGTVSGGFAEDKNVLDSYIFRPISPVISDKKILFVGSPYEVPQDATILDTIQYADGKEAFVIFTNMKEAL